MYNIKCLGLRSRTLWSADVIASLSTRHYSSSDGRGARKKSNCSIEAQNVVLTEGSRPLILPSWRAFASHDQQVNSGLLFAQASFCICFSCSNHVPVGFQHMPYCTCFPDAYLVIFKLRDAVSLIKETIKRGLLPERKHLGKNQNYWIVQ